MNYNVFRNKNLEEKNSVTSCVLSSTNYDAKLFTICRAQSIKKVLCD